MSERRLLLGSSLGLFIVVLAAYIETMAGSTSFWDCGEFIATSYTLGIPHPPGTPLYVVLGRVFTLLPLPLSVAQKVNFMSALFGALGIVVLYLLIVDLLRSLRGAARDWVDRLVIYGAALVGALFTAWSNTYWMNAIEAEVYSISTFVMGVTMLLARRWSRNPTAPSSVRSLYLIIYLLALCTGFHLGTVLVYPAIALYVLLFRRRSVGDADFVIFSFGFFLFLLAIMMQFKGVLAILGWALFAGLLLWRAASGYRFAPVASGLFLLGVTIQLAMMIMSSHDPAIDEADPETWANFIAVLRREQYPPSSMFARKASWGFQIVDHFWRYFSEQYELVRDGGRRLALFPIALGVIGIGALARRDRKSWVLFFGTWLICSAGMIVFLNFSASEPRERDYFYSPAFYFFGLFIAVGAVSLLDWFFDAADLRRLRARLGYVVGIAVLLSMTFMLYHRYHFEHDRTRERVPWGYGYNLLVGLEPNALIFTNGDNDTFPLWYQQEVENFRQDVRVLNLSLLNTSWYLFQLRDNEPKVALNWSDAQINDLRGEILGDGRVLQPRDLAMRQLVRDNYGKRPIYFAVTIPREYLTDWKSFMLLEGLVHRLSRERGSELRDYAKIEHNVTNVYQYDGILNADGKHDTSVYRDPNQNNLVTNYAGAFVHLGTHEEELAAAASDEAARAAHWARAEGFYLKAREFTPDFDALLASLGALYQRMGRAEESVRLFEDLRRRDPNDDRWLYYLATSQVAAGRFNEAVMALQQMVARNPDDDYVHQVLVQALHELGRTEEAQQVVSSWEQRHPGDRSMTDFFTAVRAGITGSILAPESTGAGDTLPAAVTPAP